jgi:hypothetical protein
MLNQSCTMLRNKIEHRCDATVVVAIIICFVSVWLDNIRFFVMFAFSTTVSWKALCCSKLNCFPSTVRTPPRERPQSSWKILQCILSVCVCVVYAEQIILFPGFLKFVWNNTLDKETELNIYTRKAGIIVMHVLCRHRIKKRSRTKNNKPDVK